ncbi:hypothetical protein AB1Y20_008933 [Prymnesium parvum]|uniref:EF-hand domain-containing protein n=1 Tax=Prymnesium parvum TaxID=97485 RepID=A0AB34K590_PRYPA
MRPSTLPTLLLPLLLLPPTAASAPRRSSPPLPSPRRSLHHAAALGGRVGASLKARLDADADGHVSVDELEAALSRAFGGVARLAARLRRLLSRRRQLCLAVGGAAGLLYGAHLPHTILFLHVFSTSGWPLARGGVQRAADAYRKAKERMPRDLSKAQPLRDELHALADELAQLRSERKDPSRQEALLASMRAVRAQIDEAIAAAPHSARASLLLLAAADPRVLRDVALGLWSALTVSVAASSSAAARSLGIGMTVGEAVSSCATYFIEASDRLLRAATTNLPSEAAALSYFGPSLLASTLSTSVALASRSACCWLAFRLQHITVVFSSSVVCARVLVHAAHRSFTAVARRCSPPLDLDDDDAPSAESTRAFDAAVWVLAVSSFQAQRAGAFRLIPGTRVVLLPVFGFEALLRHLGCRLAARESTNY